MDTAKEMHLELISLLFICSSIKNFLVSLNHETAIKFNRPAEMTLHEKNKLIEQIFLKIWESFYENNGTSNVLILLDFESYQINSI